MAHQQDERPEFRLPRKLVTALELPDHLPEGVFEGAPYSTLKRWRAHGCPSVARPGFRRRYDPQAVAEWLLDHEAAR